MPAAIARCIAAAVLVAITSCATAPSEDARPTTGGAQSTAAAKVTTPAASAPSARKRIGLTTLSQVRITSSVDGHRQPAFFLASRGGAVRPLIVSLHTWSYDYTQGDPLAALAVKEGWNYIHPNFRGPNRTFDACLSDKSQADIDDAIQYAIDHGRVDPDKIVMVGRSGGGYATLGMFLKTRHRIKLFLSWVPVSDLVAWYYQSKSRAPRYSRYIAKCTSEDGVFDEAKARARSPLYFEMPDEPNGRIEIFHGIEDGFNGSTIPISHSITFYNRIVQHYGAPDARVPENDIIDLLTKNVDVANATEKLGDRALLYRRTAPFAQLTIFDGKHEMIQQACFDRIRAAVR